jgi:hypothetical protein
MFNDETPDEEIPQILDSLRETCEDVDGFIRSSYLEICFLGTSPRSVGGELLEAVLLNARLCIEYYLQKEDYIRVAKLKNICKGLTDPVKVDIDLDILQNITVSHN